MTTDALAEKMQSVSVSDRNDCGEEIIVSDVAFGDHMEGEDEDINIVGAAEQSPDDRYFDKAIGTLMDILIEEEFEEMQAKFSSDNCHHFEEADENKLIYMDLFKKYNALIESHLERRLKEEITDFDMERFYELLSTREEYLVGEVFEMLLSLSDFATFKELMLSYKQEKQNGSLLDISVRPMMVHVDDQEDGEARPDLDNHLVVSPVGGGP